MTGQITITVPTLECVGKLPRWAQVAFAARCARRIEFIVLRDWPSAPKDYLELIEQSIFHAERSAEFPETSTEDALVSRDAAASVTDTHAQRFNISSTDSRKISAISALYSASDASYIGSRISDGDNSHLTAAVVQTATDALKAAFDVSERAGEVATLGIQRDFEILVLFAEIKGWNKDSGVSPGVFRVMWQGLPPDGCVVQNLTFRYSA